jgi:hypothetical protein
MSSKQGADGSDYAAFSAGKQHDLQFGSGTTRRSRNRSEPLCVLCGLRGFNTENTERLCDLCV